MRRCTILFLALALAHLAWGHPAAAAGKRPNIIYIMSDDHAAQAMSCYGSVVNKTPNLDRLATEGMRFNNCFCTNSLCGPCRDEPEKVQEAIRFVAGLDCVDAMVVGFMSPAEVSDFHSRLKKALADNARGRSPLPLGEG